MKLTIKTLKQKIFTLDVWGEETVFEVKEKIQAVRGPSSISKIRSSFMQVSLCSS